MGLSLSWKNKHHLRWSSSLSLATPRWKIALLLPALKKISHLMAIFMSKWKALLTLVASIVIDVDFHLGLSCIRKSINLKVDFQPRIIFRKFRQLSMVWILWTYLVQRFCSLTTRTVGRTEKRPLLSLSPPATSTCFQNADDPLSQTGEINSSWFFWRKFLKGLARRTRRSQLYFIIPEIKANPKLASDPPNQFQLRGSFHSKLQQRCKPRAFDSQIKEQGAIGLWCIWHAANSSKIFIGITGHWPPNLPGSKAERETWSETCVGQWGPWSNGIKRPLVFKHNLLWGFGWPKQEATVWWGLCSCVRWYFSKRCERCYLWVESERFLSTQED